MDENKPTVKNINTNITVVKIGLSTHKYVIIGLIII
jgi:hypothetical protein|tara:strand:- start:828 stop:935 length:108 start_codon:yes stop_codon:yes gene_type:complete